MQIKDFRIVAPFLGFVFDIFMHCYTVIVLLSIDDKFNRNFKIIWSDIYFFIFYFQFWPRISLLTW